MITEITNPYLNNHNMIKTPEGTWVEQTAKHESIFMKEAVNTTLNPSGSLEVLNTWGKKIILESLVYNVTTRKNNSSVYPELTINRASEGNSFKDQLFHIVSYGETENRVYPIAPRIESDYSEYLEVVNKLTEFQNDPDDPRVSRIISLKRPIILPFGARLIFKNSSSTYENSFTYKVVWREIEGEQ